MNKEKKLTKNNQIRNKTIEQNRTEHRTVSIAYCIHIFVALNLSIR